MNQTFTCEGNPQLHLRLPLLLHSPLVSFKIITWQTILEGNNEPVITPLLVVWNPNNDYFYSYDLRIQLQCSVGVILKTMWCADSPQTLHINTVYSTDALIAKFIATLEPANMAVRVIVMLIPIKSALVFYSPLIWFMVVNLITEATTGSSWISHNLGTYH